MDQIDRRIMDELGRDARISATQLAEIVRLSVSSTAERIRRLLNGGAVDGFDIRIDRTKAGRPVDAFLHVQLQPSADIDAVDAALRESSCVIDAKSVTGGFGYVLRIAARDTAEIDALVNHLRHDLGAAATTTTIVLSTLDGFPRPVALD